MLVAGDQRTSRGEDSEALGEGGTTGSASGQLPDFQPRPARAQVSGRHSRSSLNHFISSPPGTQGKLVGALGQTLVNGIFLEGTKAMSRPVLGFHALFPYLRAWRKLRACRRGQIHRGQDPGPETLHETPPRQKWSVDVTAKRTGDQLLLC